MQSHHIIDIEEMETNTYVENGNDSAECFPLLIGSSGGGGHNAAIEAIIEYLKAHQILKEPIVSYPPASLPKEVTAALVKLESGSIFTNHIPLISLGIKKGLDAFNMPKLPGFLDLRDEVKKINKAQQNKGNRKYKDMLLDVFPSGIGYYYVAIWNIFQKRDQTKELKKLIALQEMTDANNHQKIRDYFLKELNEGFQGRPYTEIISTQAIGLAALCDAVKAYNEKNDTNIRIHQYLTDLPTVGAVHFFKTLATLNAEQAEQLYLYGVNLKDNFDKISKWFKLPGHFRKLINIDPKNNPMVRPGFKTPALNEIDFAKAMTLSMQIKGLSNKEVEVLGNEKVASIMLGSQASNDTIDYALRLAKSNLYDKIFVFGGTADHIKDKLDKALSQEIKHKVILLDAQEDTYIAPIMTRSNLVIIRGGGLTVMEQMAMPHKHASQVILLHSKRNKIGEFTSGISWEDGNVSQFIQSFQGMQKITRTSVDEFIYELTIRFRPLLLPNEAKTKILQDNEDAVFTELANKINKLRSLDNDHSRDLTNALDMLFTDLHADYLKLKEKGLSNEKIQKSAALQIASKTSQLLSDLDNNDNSMNVKIEQISNYKESCNNISKSSLFFKAVSVVAIAAVGFLFGAILGCLLGALAGAWSGPGAIATATLGSIMGSLTIGAAALIAATAVVGITPTLITGYLLFKPSEREKKLVAAATCMKNYARQS
jgi:hypothetical protein